MTRARRRVVVYIIVLTLVGAVWAGYKVVRAVIDVPRRAYAVWWTADLVIDYMERNNGAWPRSWEDLRPVDEKASRVTEAKEADGGRIIEFRPTPPIDELREMVEVDRNVDPDKLLAEARKENDPPFRVIYLRDGGRTHYEGREPNRMILGYLESKKRRKGE